MAGLLEEDAASVSREEAVSTIVSVIAEELPNDEAALELAHAYADLFPGEAIPVDAIIGIITAIVTFIQQCRESREQQHNDIRHHNRRAVVVALRAVRQEFPNKSRRDQRRLAKAMLDRAASKPHLYDSLADDAEIIGPPLVVA